MRIRHGGELVAVARVDEREEEIHISLKTDVFGVAAGQAAVFYQGETCLGGGIIQ